MGYSLGGFSVSAPQSTIGSSRFENIVKAELSLTAWRLGKDYGGSQAMIMIAQCLANRSRKGWGTWFHIIETIPKYSATIEQPAIIYPDAWDRAFLALLTAVDSVVDGTSKDICNGALYFADTTNITNPWYLENICRSGLHNRVADLNSLTFWD